MIAAAVLAVLTFTWAVTDTDADRLVYTEIRRVPLSAPLGSRQYDPSFYLRIDAAACETRTAQYAGHPTRTKWCAWAPQSSDKDWIYEECHYWASGASGCSREEHLTCEDPTGSGCPQNIYGVPAASGGGTGTCADPIVLPSQGGVFTGTTSGVSANNGTCNGTGTFKAPEKVYSWTPGSTQGVEIKTCGSGFDTALYVRTQTCAGPQVACNDDDAGAVHCPDYHHSYLKIAAQAGTVYYIFVDGYNSNSAVKEGPYTLTVTPIAMRSQDERERELHRLSQELLRQAQILDDQRRRFHRALDKALMAAEEKPCP